MGGSSLNRRPVVTFPGLSNVNLTNTKSHYKTNMAKISNLHEQALRAKGFPPSAACYRRPPSPAPMENIGNGGGLLPGLGGLVAEDVLDGEAKNEEDGHWCLRHF